MMQRRGSLFMAALGMSVGLLTAQGIEAGEQAFIASDVVELVAREASTTSQALLPDRVSISDLEVLDEHDAAVVSSRRGMRCKFWLWYDTPICAPYEKRFAALKGGTEVFEYVWGNEQSYCGVFGAALSVTIASDAALGKYRWGGQAVTFSGSDIAFPATYQVTEVAP